ncbi:MAG: hypothetical protein D6707_00670 [Bacteroidetes bacterium]|nr:MAG: hypothetical protein D6707_00670 [Bacteroidota bacterium]
MVKIGWKPINFFIFTENFYLKKAFTYERLLAFLLAVLLLCGCGESKSPVENEEEIPRQKETSQEKKQEQLKAAKEIFYMMPSPVEVTSLLKKAGAIYNAEYLNNPQNIDNYSTVKELAVNLGIFATDLSYVSIFNQTQEAMFYMAACKKIADKLGLEKAFNEEIMSRFENNLDYSDSLLYIISDAYWLADAYLKDQERAELANYIIFGGWIEGMHIAVKTAQQAPENEQIIKRIAEQKYALQHLIKLFENQSNNNSSDILSDLKELEKIFDKITATKQPNKLMEKEGKKVISGGTVFEISPETLVELTNKIENIRNKHI